MEAVFFRTEILDSHSHKIMSLKWQVSERQLIYGGKILLVDSISTLIGQDLVDKSKQAIVEVRLNEQHDWTKRNRSRPITNQEPPYTNHETGTIFGPIMNQESFTLIQHSVMDPVPLFLKLYQGFSSSCRQSNLLNDPKDELKSK
jgi:hypothetical protein